MAPPPEYDKEPKAPDKSATNLSCEETKALHNLVNDQQTNSDNKSSSTAASTEVENNKLIETLDDGQLRALLDEAITYKCPKDREGKSSLFKELLEEVEQDEQASEAAARGLSGNRAAVNRACAVTSGRGSRSRRALPHSNSLQDLVAALAAEPAPRRHHRAPPAPAPAPVSARAIHGGSLPSGVDTSFLIGEEPARGAGYLATVRCVNPPPLGERRVSTDANCSAELDSLNRRSKPAFPMTYTARATLEIGSGAVCSGRAVTTTTASNQVRTRPRHCHRPPPARAPTAGPPERLYTHRLYTPHRGYSRRLRKIVEIDSGSVTEPVKAIGVNEIDVNDSEEKTEVVDECNTLMDENKNENQELSTIENETEQDILKDNLDTKQLKLLSALIPKVSCDKPKNNGGGSKTNTKQCDTKNCKLDKEKIPRGSKKDKRTKGQNSNKAMKVLKRGHEITTTSPTAKEQTNASAETLKTSEKGINEKSATITTSMTENANKEIKTSLTEATITKHEKKENVTQPSKDKNKKTKSTIDSHDWTTNLNNWYSGLNNYSLHASYYEEDKTPIYQNLFQNVAKTNQFKNTFEIAPEKYEPDVHNIRKQNKLDNAKSFKKYNRDSTSNASSKNVFKNIAPGGVTYDWPALYADPKKPSVSFPLKTCNYTKINDNNITRTNNNVKHKQFETVPFMNNKKQNQEDDNIRWVLDNHIIPVESTDKFSYDNDYDCLDGTSTDNFSYDNDYDYLYKSRKEYRERIGKYLVAPKSDQLNPKNIRSMSIGKPLSDYHEFDIKSLNYDEAADQKFGNSEKEKKDLEIDNTRMDSSLHNDILTSSASPMKMKDLEEIDLIEAIAVNTSGRSSTPVLEQDVIVEKIEIEATASGVEISSNTSNEVALEHGAKLEDKSPIEDTEQDKGTVIPIICKPGQVTIDTNERLCSFSLEKEQSLEIKLHPLPQQHEDLDTIVLNVNPTNAYSENHDEHLHSEESVLSKSDGKRNSFFNVLNEDGIEPFSNYDRQQITLKNRALFNNDNEVEPVDMSLHGHEKDVFRDSASEPTKLNNFLECEDTSFSNIFVEQQKLQEKDTSYNKDIELADMSSASHEDKVNKADDCTTRPQDASFLKYVAGQEQLFKTLESNVVDSSNVHSLVSSLDISEKVHTSVKDNLSEDIVNECREESHEDVKNVICSKGESANDCDLTTNLKILVLRKSSNGPVVLTLPFKIFPNDCIANKLGPYAIEYSNHIDLDKVLPHEANTQNLTQDSSVQQNKTSDCNKKSQKPKSKKRTNVALEKKKIETAKKKALKAIMFENYCANPRRDKSMMSSVSIKEVDSAIPFSCITTPEVVASCNTTSSTQSAVAVDPKPLQLASSYRAVASLVEPASPPRAASPPPPPAPLARPPSAEQPRSVIASSFNGLPLTRPNYSSSGSAAQDEYKKSIDENGNSVQGLSSPVSGSSQHKKPRRKKSSKNETVITSHQIEGYQGNRDINEVLRFIESDTTRAGKLGRAKHRDDADDKGGKKRSGTRKDKESKMKRATSMEELSCSRMEDLTDKPSPPARAPRHSDQAKAERRSWGDDARDAASRFFREEPIDVPVVPDTEFQTVTKKRKPRRRADDPPEPAGGDPPRATRPPEPRARRVSAPPSDRSNDSNDDMDSVHSLPADAAAGRSAMVSYADIARTRHNIPDLIESCNYYSEEQERGDRVECLVGVECPPAAPSVEYPALEPPPPRAAPPAKHRDARPRALRKVERSESGMLHGTGTGLVDAAPLPAEWPAPDVVADRRPAVILLDSAAQARDMDGVTFGFDINETLLGGPTRRPRCDLIRDALEMAALPVAATNGVALPLGGGGLPAGCGLRYVPPAPLPPSPHLHQIIDYIGGAWEDVLRCGGGKVHYYSE